MYRSVTLSGKWYRDSLSPMIAYRAEDGEIMGIRVRGLERPAEGIQYHPESMMTEYGEEQIVNFLKNAGVLS